MTSDERFLETLREAAQLLDWEDGSKEGFRNGAHSEFNVAAAYRQWTLFDPLPPLPAPWDQLELFPVDARSIP